MNKSSLIQPRIPVAIFILISALVLCYPFISSAQEKKTSGLTCPAGTTSYYDIGPVNAFSPVVKNTKNIQVGIITTQDGKDFYSILVPGVQDIETKKLVHCIAPADINNQCAPPGTPLYDQSGALKGCSIFPIFQKAPLKITQPLERYNVKIDIPCQKIAGGACPEATTPAGFITRFYQFSLMIAGLAAFGSIVFGAIQYILAAGKFAALEDAKSRIYQAIIGLLLLLGAYLVLYTINPQLVRLRNPSVTPIELKSAGETNGTSQTSSSDFGSKSNLFSDTPEQHPFCKTGTFSGVTISSNLTKVEEKGREAPTFSCVTPKPNAHLDEKTGEAVCNEGYVGLMAFNNSRCIPIEECLNKPGYALVGNTICQQE